MKSHSSDPGRSAISRLANDPRRLPVVLSDEEACRLLECVTYPKHRAIMLTSYAAGLRLSGSNPPASGRHRREPAQIRVRAEKGAKKESCPPRQGCWASFANTGNDPPTQLSFPWQDAGRALVVGHHAKGVQAGDGQVGDSEGGHAPHDAPFWATGMLEAGVDLLTISKLLGHSSFVTTMIYLHVRRQHFDRSPSPIDWLPVRQCPKWAEANDSTAPVEPTVTPGLSDPPVASEPPSPDRVERRKSGRKTRRPRRRG